MVKAWCPRCNLVDSVTPGWRCVWCFEVTLKARARAGQPHPGSISVPQLRLAHRLHAEGATLREAAERVEHGYASDRILAQRLPSAFAGLGLPYRSISDAQRLRAVTKGQAHQRADVTVELVVAALREHASRSAAAKALGVSPRTIRRRLARAR